MSSIKINVKELAKLNQWLARLSANNNVISDQIELKVTSNGIGTTIQAHVRDTLDTTCGYWCDLTQDYDW
jgi:hypothetical protein